MRVRLLATDTRDTALDRSSSGTAFAATAVLAGPENEKQVPSRKPSTSRWGTRMLSATVSAASTVMTTATPQ